MARKCNHDQGNGQGCHQQAVSADGWTNMGTFGEYVSSFISDGFWMATLFDTCAGFDPDIAGVSYYALGFGLVVASLSAAGAAYSHRSLNIHHQPGSEETGVVACGQHQSVHHHTDLDVPLIGHSDLETGHQCHSGANDHPVAHDRREHGGLETGHQCHSGANDHADAHDRREHEHGTRQQQVSSLGRSQIICLAFDFLSHTGDKAGPMTFVFSLATQQHNIPRWGKAVAQAGAALFGGLCSVADVRSCADAMRKENANRPGLN